MATMVKLTPHDASILSRLAQFYRLLPDESKTILNQIVSSEAREVGEAVLDPEKLSSASEPVRETAIRYQQWVENNQKIGRRRRRAAGSRNNAKV